jgi:hypothetical protein
MGTNAFFPPARAPTMMRILRVAAGIVLLLLGALWSLQGADLLHIKPILCFADCQVLIGGSTTWLIVGLITIGVGALLLFFRRAPRSPD